MVTTHAACGPHQTGDTVSMMTTSMGVNISRGGKILPLHMPERTGSRLSGKILQSVQLVVQTLFCQQIAVGSLFIYPAAVQNDNPVRLADC